MLQYSGGNSPASPGRTISGRTLAQQRWPAPRRAITAADLVLGELEIVDLTVLQAAALCKVSQPYVAAALRIAGDPSARSRVLNGFRPLIEARSPVATKANGLLRAYAEATPDEVAAFRHTVGAAALWDTLVAPELS